MAAPGQEAPNAVAPVAGLTQQPPETPPAPKTPPAKPAPLKFSAAAAPPPHKSHPSSKPKVKKRPNRAIPQTEPSASPRETDEVKEWEIYPPQDSLWAPEAEKETAK